ncbi:MAG TPA: hypothetical protein PLM62_06000, partial [Zoogloea sp.]|nr:hypothetical protein [Zoogloea sp.]
CSVDKVASREGRLPASISGSLLSFMPDAHNLVRDQPILGVRPPKYNAGRELEPGDSVPIYSSESTHAV